MNSVCHVSKLTPSTTDHTRALFDTWSLAVGVNPLCQTTGELLIKLLVKKTCKCPSTVDENLNQPNFYMATTANQP